jgi:hypothetical protein
LAPGPNLILLACTRISPAGQTIKPRTTEFEEDPPFLVPIRVYDQTIQALKSAVRKAKLGHDEEVGALKRLDDQARRLEHHVSGPSVEAFIAQERRNSHAYGGRSVFGWEQVEEEDLAPTNFEDKTTPRRLA